MFKTLIIATTIAAFSLLTMQFAAAQTAQSRPGPAPPPPRPVQL